MEVATTDPLVECLLAISTYHGRSTSRDGLTAGLPLENSCLTPALFNRAANRAGLVSRLVRRPLKRLQKALLPAVLLLENDEACVYMGLDVSGENAKVIYPELNEAVVSVPIDELVAKYTGVALLVRTRFRFDKRVTQTHHSLGGHWFWDAIKENQSIYRDVLIAAFCINIFALAMPLFTMNVYDRVVPNRAIETLWMLAMGVSIVMIADVVLKMMRAYFLDLAGRRIDINLSAKIMERVLGMRLESRPLSTGSFAASLRSFETIRDFTTSATVTALIDLPFTLIFIAVIGWIAWPMVIPLVLGVLTVLAYILISRKKMQALTESTYSAGAMRNATLIETLVGLDTLKAMGAESRMQHKWEKTTAFLARIGVQLRMLSTANISVTMFVQQLVTLLVIVIGVYLISDGLLSMGGLIACSMLSSRAIAPLGQVTGLLAHYHSATTSMASLDEIMKKPLERPAEAKFLTRNSFKGNIEFKDVHFSYPDSPVSALKGLSFTIKQGEHVAILGRVGSGKSTLEKLIMGLYQPSSGSIMMDGIDQRQLDPAELRHQIGYVPQDGASFPTMTVREHLAFALKLRKWSESKINARVKELSEMLGIGYILERKPNGLSGGESQRVALGRALASRPDTLCLDEPLSALDQETHHEMCGFLRHIQEQTGVTVLHITHNPEEAKRVADHILVLEEGEVKESENLLIHESH